MSFQVGDKVKVRDEAKVRGMDVWGKVGEVVDIVDDGTAIQRITVEFPDGEKLIGVVAGLFERV